MEITKESIEEIDNAKEQEGMKKTEAALFIAGKFLSMKELVALTDINPILLRKILDDLEEDYSGSAIQIIRREDMWKMDVAPEYFDMVHKLATGSAEFSKAEQETLAMIAYKQPIKQSVIIKIRGNKAYEHIQNFVNLGLLIKKKAGHTSELSLSDSFYDYFNLNKDKGIEA